tara:strand:- start:453 stop:1331 length:879 start_codon:yes stop_codon:yes gene_type:complete
MAGIIPVANLETDFNVELPGVMMPVNAGFTAIQKSVYECAIVGCQTIWIVANNDLAPIIRKTVGEWTYDPVYYSTMSKYPADSRREIPIYYVPIHPKDRDKRDAYGWSILYGAYSAWLVAAKISKWVLPEKFYVSFPLSVYDLSFLRTHRLEIASRDANFFLSYDGKTVKDDLPIAFTFDGEDFKACRNHINQTTSREYLPRSPGQIFPTQRLPFAERWSARQYPLSKIFQKLSEKNKIQKNVDRYHDISQWSQYCSYLGSKNLLEKPYKPLTKAHKHAKIPYRVEGTNEDT